jgi:hypothetical protein
MTEELEPPTEHLHETLQEHALEHSEGAGWMAQVALSSAIIAVIAAVSAMLGGHHANEAMLEQMRANDDWAYFQAKGIKAALVETKRDLLSALAKEARDQDREKLAEYRKEQKEIEDKAHEEEKASREHMARHGVLSRAVTTSQVAIALSAISVLTRKKWIWYLAMGFGAVGGVLLGMALV